MKHIFSFCHRVQIININEANSMPKLWGILHYLCRNLAYKFPEALKRQHQALEPVADLALVQHQDSGFTAYASLLYQLRNKAAHRSNRVYQRIFKSPVQHVVQHAVTAVILRARPWQNSRYLWCIDVSGNVKQRPWNPITPWCEASEAPYPALANPVR